MSSLLKMNQKFLSKSSWSIRGGGSSNSSPSSNNNNVGSKTQNTSINSNNNNRINFRSPQTHTTNNNISVFGSGVSPTRYDVSSSNHQHHHTANDRKSIPGGSNDFLNHQTQHKSDGKKKRRPPSPPNKSANQSKKMPFVKKSTPDEVDRQSINYSTHNRMLVNSQVNGQIDKNSSLLTMKRVKGMSISMTDLREIETTKTDDLNLQNDNHVEREIKERRIDMYIAEIEMEPLFQLGSTIRAIYDGDEHDRFQEKLDSRIKNHDKDIERMCNCHYQGFVDCIHELLKVRPQAQDLKSEINQIKDELLKSSENIQRKADELIKYRRVLCNTKMAIEHLQECLPMLETFSKLSQQMSEKKYYSALKTLEQFERLYMSKLKKYRFAQTMCSKVPKIRETIKKESMKDLKDFLENIRHLTFKIGEIAMRNTAHLFKTKEFATILLQQKDSKQTTLRVSKNFQTPKRDSKLHESLSMINGGTVINGRKDNSEENEEDDEFLIGSTNEELSATDLVDFSPVYRCLHIFGCLGARDQFESYYRQQRKQQAKLILQSFFTTASHQLNSSALVNNHTMSANVFNSESFSRYLFGVVGFFVIEDHLLNTSNGLVTKEYLKENWNDVIASLIENVHHQATLCQDSQQMLTMKSLLMLFCETTQSYGYSVEPIMKLLVELRQLYIDILLRQWSLIFKKIFDSDNYHPLVVNNQVEFDEIFREFIFDETEVFNNEFEDIIQKEIFPKKFPFSLFVPKVYKEVKEFIVVCLKFIDDLNLSASDKEDTVRKSTNLLLTRTLSDSLSSLIKKSNLGLLQLIQTSINTNYLEEASNFLEIFIFKLIHNKSVKEISSKTLTSSSSLLRYSTSMTEPPSQSHLARLQGRTMFKDARSEAESQIYIQLNKKIDEIFSLANYDYLLADSPGKASSYILDLMAFLKTTFEAFTNLPLKVAQTACLSACKFISSRLLNILLEEDTKAISQGFMQQFNLDLMQCEMFAGSEPVKEFEEGALQTCFIELRQTMDLFIEFDSWATYFAEQGKNESRYLRVNPHTALILMEKLNRGDSKKPNLFSALSKNERDKKNKMDTILKKLRQLVANNNSSNNN